MAVKQLQSRPTHAGRPAFKACTANVRSCKRRVVSACATGGACGPAHLPEGMLRRSVLLGTSALAATVLLKQEALAEDGAAVAEFKTLRGMATPPTSYGGYGGNANESPKYSFEYPTSWKTETPSKVEKGTQGVDSRVVNPRAKDQRAFVITLARAGEDNVSFRITDTDATFAGFAGADYDLQDALSNASATTKSEVEVDGTRFYLYDIESPDFHYLSSIAVKAGKVYALFVRSPSRTFKNAEPQLRHIVDTFKLL